MSPLFSFEQKIDRPARSNPVPWDQLSCNLLRVLAMSTTKKPAVHHIVEAKRWELSREKERITYPVEVPI